MLQIKNLSKSYGAKKAISNLSFVVEDGDIMGFIGKNGAGKTTTLKACLGIIGIDEGEILLDGTSVLKEPMACKRKMAYVPDNPQLDEYMTGLQYLNFICDIYEVPSKMRKQNFEKLASAFQMGPHLNNLISSYSHGMKQKLALIAAFSHTPKLLILDEPFVGLYLYKPLGCVSTLWNWMPAGKDITMHYQKVLKMPESIPYLSVGFDVGADFTWMSIMLPNGILIGKPFKIIHSDPQSRELAISKIKEAQEMYSLESRCFLESTGIYHIPLLCFLRDKGFDCAVINPIITKNSTNMNVRKLHNDKFDSKKAAKVGLDASLKASIVPDDAIIDLRNLVRDYYYFKDLQSAIVLKLHAELNLNLF